MRSEKEIVDSVLALAERDDGVRAVIRTDLLPVRKYLHSCNFIFIVSDIGRYDGDVFHDSFGGRILLFRADRRYPEMFPGTKAHLMVFGDGATIVIQAMDRDAFLERYCGGHEQRDVWIGDTYQKLLDKDGLLSMDDRLCIANMSIEAGAKNGIFPVDEITEAYMKGRVDRPWTAYAADPDAEYTRTVEIDLNTVEPTVSFPHLPENAHPISDVGDIAIDQVIIGSCTNGRLEDMAIAAEILKGRKVDPNVRCIVMPATQQIFKDCIEKGYMTTFIDAGCAVSTPTCGPCLGGHMGVMANGEKCVATTNRNFVGRMGGITSEIYLASPAVAAASAIAGKIADPRKL